MKGAINCFVPYPETLQAKQTIEELKQCELIKKIYLLTNAPESDPVAACEMLPLSSLVTTEAVRTIASLSDAPFSLIYTKDTTFELSLFSLERLLHVAQDTDAGLVYADHYLVKDGIRTENPLIDYQDGSLRDDFNFGPLLLYKKEALEKAVKRMEVNTNYAALYELRLWVAVEFYLLHVTEYLYTEIAKDSNTSIFDYVDPKNRAVQLEMEAACTAYLRAISAYLEPTFRHIDFNMDAFEFEASVIIPVRNRIRTIEDAIRSVLCQHTSFKFNLIIIDNYSTDGTTAAIDKYTSDPRLIHIIPKQKDLGIGGCWNIGAHHPQCGKFAVQLDSDDVYSDEHTLQKMVDAFYEQQCAMVVGTYRMTDFDMNTIPPGIIDHKEWTPENGRNNALRINGLGAPRAFYTPLLRKIKVPNTSYGEDYALGLRFSREYQIGRVYDVVYLCRRWEDNSDASADVLKMNKYNFYKDRIRTWELAARVKLNQYQRISNQSLANLFEEQQSCWSLARVNYFNLKKIRTKELLVDGHLFRIQHNPGRIYSASAKVDNESVKSRACFLCEENLPPEQLSIAYNPAASNEWSYLKHWFKDHKFKILVNPYPVFPEHFTIVKEDHEKQLLFSNALLLLDIAKKADKYTIFYNGAHCGASAPDHMHYQAIPRGSLPFEQELPHIKRKLLYKEGAVSLYSLKDCLRSTFLMESTDIISATLCLLKIGTLLPLSEHNCEAMINTICWYDAARELWTVCLFWRKAHRPACYYAKGNERLLVSPGAIEMGGVFIVPHEDDFERISENDIRQILSQVCYSDWVVSRIGWHLRFNMGGFAKRFFKLTGKNMK